ncbi:chitooligosaccharidolytic beta-N-acetylglucosaminidase-like [Sitophilus oryzae]|uniref:Beta-hexosaminidase n=1 Tax=Sitophilus oryzae TaxID=7048 RepID=A0A6J2Y014_SITOR|nr:chitooligosaccharidolytic beta-N-acetylglucosaminidase-like [Sitophilus oryzae]
MARINVGILFAALLLILFQLKGSSSSPWHYECKSGSCTKTETTPNSSATWSFAECSIQCLEYAGLWPIPTGTTSIGNFTEININNISLSFHNGSLVSTLVYQGFDIFLNQIKNVNLIEKGIGSKNASSVNIKIDIVDQDLTILTLKADESYYLEINQHIEGVLNVSIQSETYFGARHALETLSQLIIYDDIRKRFLASKSVKISDKPIYPWRGIILDTARNYVPIKYIKRTIKAMAASKMNTFHWHLTDSQRELYVYGDLLEQFGTEIFHMGGDEININCWNSTESLKKWMTEKGWALTKENFIKKAWFYFQNRTVQSLYKKAGKEIPVILWTSDLTNIENVTRLLDKERYIIQMWSNVYDSTLENLLRNNYSVILSNYDSLYLDCGFGDFTNDDNNWCTPYKTWQQLYENKPKNIVGSKANYILGAEAALWTEIADHNSMDSKIWPRASALAEALWSEPNFFWTEAEDRLHLHRERLVNLGVRADTLQPEWCLQHQRQCRRN